MGGEGGGVGGNFGAFCETNQAAALVRPPVVRWDRLPRAQLVLISNQQQNHTCQKKPFLEGIFWKQKKCLDISAEWEPTVELHSGNLTLKPG